MLGLIARTEKDVQAVAEEIQALGVKTSYATADVSNREEVEAAVAKLQDDLRQVDILINNAGAGTFGKFLELEREGWENQIKVNVFGVYYTTRAVLPQMIERKTGDIINISSTAGKSGSAVTSAYSASKFAVFGLSKSLMQEVCKHNIRVTALAPSTIVTDLAQLKLNRHMLLKEASVFSTNP